MDLPEIKGHSFPPSTLTLPNGVAILLRQVESHDEYQECVTLQQETWGGDFRDFVPAALLKVNQKISGLVAGAFTNDARLIGFVFGMTGLHDRKPVHWSHMLAVREEYRGSGLGKCLKLYQRDFLLSLDIDVVYWTYDPLVARNANLNFNGLGAGIASYVPDMYIDTGSKLHHGLGMDRFIAVWKLTDERVLRALRSSALSTGDPYVNAIIVNTDEERLSNESIVRIEIPYNIEAVQTESTKLGRQWREQTRRAFLYYLSQQYIVDGFYIDRSSKRCFYGLRK